MQLELPNGQILYPITIVEDRYTGVYSGGAWTAWNHEPQEIPYGVIGEDTEARNEWDSLRDDDDYRKSFRFGVGETIGDALFELVLDVEKRGFAPDLGYRPVVKCKNCRYRPVKKSYEYGEVIEPPKDEANICPCIRDDSYYNYVPDDDFFCANGREKIE